MRTPFRLLLCFVFLAGVSALAQENYEIQVYPGDTLEPRATMVELHSNWTIDGAKSTADGTQPTYHALHETLEITQGVNDWFETGFYIFTSARSGDGWQFVGTHIRPRVAAPARWKWPVGVSLSMEIGYARPMFTRDTWSLELRPIVDKKIQRWYLSFNPVFGKSLHGPGAADGFEFSPNVKVSYDVTKQVAFGAEYYGTLGPTEDVLRLRDQQHQVFATCDLDVSPKWEINFGVGVGMTASTDRLIVKGILGRRFEWKRKP